MLGHLEAMLGLCWAILGLCWALLAAFGPKNSTPTEAWLRWGWILGRFRAQNKLKTSCAIYLLILKEGDVFELAELDLCSS